MDLVRDFFQAIDELVARWGDLVTPLYGNGKRPGEVEGVGSGFVLSHEEKLYLVTARHVVEKLKNCYQHQVTNIFGEGLYLSGRGFKTDEGFDVAITELSSDEFNSLGLEKIKYIPLETSSAWRPTGIFVVMGYPASRNVLQAQYGKVDRKLYSLSVGLYKEEDISTDIVDAIIFEYDHEKVLTSDLSRANPPALRGMSGGPALQVVVNNQEETPRVGFSLAGVLCEWHEQERAIVAAPSSAIAELIAWSPS